MFLSLVILALSIFSNAQLVPTAPGPNDVFKEGGSCSLAWTVDTTGQWKRTFIELMDGPNDQMHHLATIAQIDGTDSTKTSLTITCPKVTVHSAIYFYQFTAAGQNTTWTTRFTIADANGGSTLPTNVKQPNGDPIPWGIGQLVDASQGSPPPPTAPPGQVDDSSASGGNLPSPNSTAPVLTAGTPSSVVSTAGATSTPSSPPIVSVPTASFGGVSLTSSASAAAMTTSSSSSSTNGGGNGAASNSMSTMTCAAIAAIFAATAFY